MASTPTVRVATVDDAAAFAACQLECWREAYTELWGEERLAELDLDDLTARRTAEIADGTAVHVLAELDGEVIGVAISGPSRDEDAPTPEEVYATFVRQQHQGSGVADDLLEATIDGRPVSLWTYRDNPRAAAFYVNHGFIPDGAERPDSMGIMEIRMVRAHPQN